MCHAQEISELQKQLAACTVAAKEMAIMRKIRELQEEDQKSAQPVQDRQ